MRYSYEFKRKAIELFYQGEWVKLEQLHGPDINKFRVANKSWSPEEKYKLVCQVLSGQALSAIAIIAGINSGQLYQWVHKYKTLGYNGLMNKSKGRPLLADLLIANCCALIAEYSPSMRFNSLATVEW